MTTRFLILLAILTLDSPATLAQTQRVHDTCERALGLDRYEACSEARLHAGTVRIGRTIPAKPDLVGSREDVSTTGAVVGGSYQLKTTNERFLVRGQGELGATTGGDILYSADGSVILNSHVEVDKTGGFGLTGRLRDDAHQRVQQIGFLVQGGYDRAEVNGGIRFGTFEDRDLAIPAHRATSSELNAEVQATDAVRVLAGYQGTVLGSAVGEQEDTLRGRIDQGYLGLNARISERLDLRARGSLAAFSYRRGDERFSNAANRLELGASVRVGK